MLFRNWLELKENSLLIEADLLDDKAQLKSLIDNLSMKSSHRAGVTV